MNPYDKYTSETVKEVESKAKELLTLLKGEKLGKIKDILKIACILASESAIL